MPLPPRAPTAPPENLYVQWPVPRAGRCSSRTSGRHREPEPRGLAKAAIPEHVIWSRDVESTPGGREIQNMGELGRWETGVLLESIDILEGLLCKPMYKAVWPSYGCFGVAQQCHPGTAFCRVVSWYNKRHAPVSMLPENENATETSQSQSVTEPNR